MCKVVQLGSTTTTTAAATVPLASWNRVCLAWPVYRHGTYTHTWMRVRARATPVFNEAWSNSGLQLTGSWPSSLGPQCPKPFKRHLFSVFKVKPSVVPKIVNIVFFTNPRKHLPKGKMSSRDFLLGMCWKRNVPIVPTIESDLYRAILLILCNM